MEQIELFFKVGKKCDNDGYNKIREDILQHILTIPEEYLNSPQYGEKWREVQTGWREVLNGLCKDILFNKIHIVKMAGRCYNYDYTVNYINECSEVVKKQCVEFKYNSSSLEKIPQFLQVYENSGFLKSSYSEFYYNNYLSKHIENISGLVLLEREVYLKLVKGVNYNCNPFFASLKAAEENSKEIKTATDKIVKSSIATYLSTFARDIDLDILKRRLEAQSQKVFLMWKSGKFTKDTISIGTNLEYKGVKNNNTIVVEDIEQQQEYHLLLRWKNHKGVLNPAWQISLHKGLTLAKKLVK